MFSDSERDIFNATGGWTILHRAHDDWEVSLIRAAFTRADIPHKIGEEKSPTGRLLYAVAVPVESEDEATDVLLHVVDAIRQPHQPDEPPAAPEVASAPVRAIPTDVPIRVIATREGIGDIVHIEGHGYELRVGPEPYFIVPDDRWEEFTDFSAQRQEFSILLEKEFESLYKWLRIEKKFADFLRLVESTYRGGPEDDTPEHFLRAAGWMLAILLGIAALVALFRWLEGLTVGMSG
jgi:hypothetical protein